MVWWSEIGQWIIHAYVYPHFQRHDIGAWGIRSPLLRFAADHGIEEIYYWDNKKRKVYCTTLTSVQALGTLGDSDRYGGTVNVPVTAWLVLKGKLKGIQWVPKEEVIVLEPCERPWEMEPTPPPQPAAAPPSPPTTTSLPTPVQLTLDF